MKYREWEIFKKADKVYAYLGEEIHSADTLAEVFDKVDELIDGDYDDYTGEERRVDEVLY